MKWGCYDLWSSFSISEGRLVCWRHWNTLNKSLAWRHNTDKCNFFLLSSGLEFSEKAIYLLSEENQFGLQESAIEGFGKVFQNAEKSIQIYCGDLFEFSKDTLVENCEIGAVIDKGSFVAIDSEMREKYLQVMASFVESPKCR